LLYVSATAGERLGDRLRTPEAAAAWAWVGGMTLYQVQGGCAQAVGVSPLLAPVVHLRVAGRPRFGPGDAGVTALAASPHPRYLSTLMLSCNQISGRRLAALAASPALKSVTVLDVRHSRLRAGGLKSRAAAPLGSHPAELPVAVSGLGPRAVQALVGGPRKFPVRALDASGNKIGDARITAIATSPWFPELEEVDLSDTGVGDAGAAALVRSALRHRQTTVRVDRRVPETALEILRGQFPGVLTDPSPVCPCGVSTRWSRAGVANY
jgi:hypothetical protein